MTDKIAWPAAERNRGPILEVLRRVLPPDGLVLEVASGPGQHAAHFASALPGITWQPSDPKPEHLASIRAWRDETGAPNLLEPLAFDVRGAWPAVRPVAIYAANLLHVAPWDAILALFEGARRATDGPLVVYGPFLRGPDSAPSNLAFSDDLRARDPAWGVRELDDVVAAAARAGWRVDEVVPMPANNLVVVWRPA